VVQMKPTITSWVTFETEKYGEAELYLAFHSFEDYPEVRAIKGLLVDDNTEVNLTEDDNFDPDDYLTPSDWDSLMMINHTELQQYYIDLAEERADVQFDNWRDRQDELDWADRCSK